jgi:pimeloyl-ACP methyl ester carboxylesterase
VRINGPWTHRDVSANGILLHVAEAGDGPLVLLLHGFPEFWWSWRHQLVALAEAGFRAVAVDLRGYGDSDKPPRGYDGWTLAGDVAGLIRALGEQKAALVGHGWGGILAWTVVAMHPRLIRAVAALAAPHPLALRRALLHPASPRAFRQAVAARHLMWCQLPVLPERELTSDGAAGVERVLRAWSGPKWAATPEFDEVARRTRQAMLVHGAAHSALEYFRWAARSQLRSDGRQFADAINRRPEVPVLQLHGAVDPYLLPATARASWPWLGPRSSFRLLPDVGHFPHEEAADATSRILIEFLERT